jgi:tetratricopeptide (TPR) repeat protein
MARGHRNGSRLGGHWLASLAIAGTGLLLYANTLRAPFLFDDHRNLLENPAIRWRTLSLENLRRASFGSPSLRPVANLSFGLNYYLHGEATEGYHVVNVLVHCANAMLVALLAHATLLRLARLPGERVRIRGRRAAAWLALGSGLLFVAHPLQTNSVTYVVQRMTSLATLFTLVALLLYARGRERPPGGARRALLGAAVASGLLALGSKEIAVTLPLAAWLYEWFFLRDLEPGFARRSLPRLGIPLALAGLALYVAFFYGPEWGYAKRDFTLGERLLTQLRVVVIYLSLILVPHPARLNLLHDVETSRSWLEPPTTLVCGLLLLGLLVGGVLLARRFRLVSFAILWFFLQLLLESTVLPLEMIYEHRTYLPMVGVALAVPWLGWAALPSRPRAAAALAALALAALASGTWIRNQTWRDNETLWRDVVAKSPRNPRGYSNLASSLQEQERYEESLAPFREALRLDLRHGAAWRGLGSSLTALGRLEEAVAAFREAIRLDGSNYQALGGLGTALTMLGRSAEGEAYLRRALGLFPDERLFNNLGRLLDQEGRTAEAIDSYAAALRLSPGYPPTHLNLGLLHEREGRVEEAIHHFRRVLESVDDAETHARLGSALWKTGQPREAIEHLERAHRLRPDWIEVANNLAWMLATCPETGLRDPPRALRLAEEALGRQGHSDPGLLDSLAAALAALGRFEEATAQASRAIDLAAEQSDPALAAEIQTHRDLYAAGRAWIEPVAPDPKPEPRRGLSQTR